MAQEQSIKYTSIKSVLDDIYSMVPDVDWNEEKMLEWVAKGYRKLNLPSKYVEKVAFIDVSNHQGALPTELKYINQMFYREGPSTTTEEDLEEIAKITGIEEDKPFYRLMVNADEFHQRIYESNYFTRYYQPLRRYDGHFGFQPCTQDIPRTNCQHHYSYEGDYIMTSFSTGCIMLSYLAYQKDCDGLDMIPDDEVLKDALFHFAMYRYWMSRSIMQEQGSMQRMRYHQQMYTHNSKRAAARLNMPDTDGWENLKNLTQRLVPRSNFYDSGFSRISNRENIKF
jgi:hypothetical protein